MRFPVTTNKSCRRGATSVAVVIEVFSFCITQTQFGLSLVGEEAEEDLLLGLCEDDLTYVGRRGSTRARARLFTVTACYQCFPMVD